MHARLLTSVAFFAAIAATQGHAGQSTTPGALAGGSGNVIVGGKPAARAGEVTTGGAVVGGGSGNVFINGKPAVTQGDTTSCGGLVIGGNASVLVNGKPLAAGGDQTTGCNGN